MIDSGSGVYACNLPLVIQVEYYRSCGIRVIDLREGTANLYEAVVDAALIRIPARNLAALIDADSFGRTGTGKVDRSEDAGLV